MNRNILKYFFAFMLLIFMTACPQERAKEELRERPVIIAYVGGYNGLVDVDKISVEKITHINYAFVNVVEGKAVLTNLATDSINFRKLNLLKEKSPDLKILISLGGWSWSGNFSDAVLTPEARETFAESAVNIMRDYNLDGVDIDWEYPAMEGDVGNIYRPEDKQNYTLVFEVLRKKLDVLSETTKKSYLLTTAVGGSQSFIDNTEMDKVQSYLDYVNIMTYDYQSDSLAIHHTNLYESVHHKNVNSADIAVKAYVKAGVPYEKLVMGIAFYGRTYQLKENRREDNTIGDPIVEQIKGYGFSFIKDSLESKDGFVKRRDDKAKAPYLTDINTGKIITYDDEQSVKEKCRYVLDNKMGGVMFWEYFSDPKEYLLDEINKEL